MGDKNLDKIIGLKVDVDTFDGMRNGVPVLMSLFKKYNIHASFFVPMGKDHTGRTVKRVFRKKGFLKKAGRVGVLGTYGLRTLMYGILLPGPEIALRNANLLKNIEEEGHEVGIHGLDHVYWHDSIKGLNKERTTRILQKACSTYHGIFKKHPLSFAAPGWMVNSHALRFFEENGFIYTSDTRGDTPFFPVMENETFRILQIPTTMPTLDEVIGIEGKNARSLNTFFLNKLKPGLNILTVHTELEGKRWTAFLELFIKNTLASGFVYHRLVDIAEACKQEGKIPVCTITYGYVNNRAGEVSLQKVCQQNGS